MKNEKPPQTKIPCGCGDPRCNYDNYWSERHAKEAQAAAPQKQETQR